MKTYIAQLSMGHDQMRFEELDKSDKVHSLESATFFTREYTEHGCSMDTATLSYVTIQP